MPRSLGKELLGGNEVLGFELPHCAIEISSGKDAFEPSRYAGDFGLRLQEVGEFAMMLPW